MKAIRDALWNNPLLIDRGFLMRRLLGGSHTGRRTLFYVLGAFVLLLLVGLAGAFPTFMTPRNIVLTQTGLLTFIVPVLLYASIAAEREKRSWDLLRVCPLTNGQIVMGKYGVAMLFVLFAASFLLIPCAVSELSMASQFFARELGYYGRYELVFGQFVVAELISLLYAAGIGALSIWVSSWSRRGFSAMLTILALLVLFLLFVPVLLSAFGLQLDQDPMVYFWHPFMVLSIMGAHSYSSGVDGIVETSATVITGLAAWVFLTALFLWLACGSVDEEGRRITFKKAPHAGS